MAGTKGRRRWTAEEDARLQELVQANAGAQEKRKWRDVAAALPGRSEAQCQHRHEKVGGWVGG